MGASIGGSSRFEVVINHEEQYSIWPAGQKIAAGWRTVGRSGTREDCRAYIEEVWTDMRPLSLRQRTDLHDRMETLIRQNAGR